MAAYNPCYCWNLKDGCITIGIWSLVYSLTQIGLFGWQSYILQGCRQLLMIDSTMNNCQDWCPCARNPSVGTTQTLVEGIFIVQILNLIAAFFLLFASAALIYGIHTNSKHMVWPWFPCIVCSIACSAAYCIMWWAGNVESYWLVLTIVEFLSILVNLYCLLCVIIQYRRIVKGYVQQTYDDEYKPKQLVYEYRPKEEVETYPEKIKTVDGYHNATYEPDVNTAKKVSLYKGGLGNVLDEDGQQPQLHVQPTYVQYQPYQLQPQQYKPAPQQAYELPVKSVPVVQEGSPQPFKERFTEAWIKGVNNVHPDEPKAQVVSAHTSPERPFQRTKSLDAIQGRSYRRRHHRMRSAKSKDSVSSRHSHRHRRRTSYSSTSESSSDDDDGTATTRSYRRSRHRDSDSDTGYSASVANSDISRRDDRHRRSSRHKSHDVKEKRRHRRPRDVKRDDKGRGASAKSASEYEYEETPGASASEKLPDKQRHPLVGGVPVLPSAYQGQAGGITIPQHIVIPAQPKGAPQSNQPQRYHINSEITIRYNNDGQPIGQEPGKRPMGPTGQPVSTATMTSPLTAPSPQSTASTVPIGGQRATNIDSSGGDSKGYSSTAV